MKKFNCDFSVHANTQKEAEAKLNALAILASFLTEKELDRLAHIVKNDPIKTSMAKTYLGM